MWVIIVPCREFVDAYSKEGSASALQSCSVRDAPNSRLAAVPYNEKNPGCPGFEN